MSEMAGPFNRGDTIINKHFTFTLLYVNTFRSAHQDCCLVMLVTS